MTGKLTIIICVCSRYSPACCGSAGSEAPSSPAPSCVAELWVSNTQCAISPHQVILTVPCCAVISFLCVPETRGMDLEQLESIYKRQPEVN